MHDIQFGLLGILGICIASGVLGAYVFQKLRIPQVVGYIVIGVLLGDTGFGLLHGADIVTLRPFNNFALGLIGFLVGGELHGDMFRKYGRQFMAILLGEGLAAFVLVGALSTLILYLVLGNLMIAIAAGVVFGAIASATDPASTIDVLWEYRSAGVLTTSIIAIVALDDALAMALYGIGTSIASILMHAGNASIGVVMLHTAIELAGAVVVGFLAGFALNALMHHLPQTDKRLGMSIGIILFCIGLALAFKLDVILTTMVIGIVLINRAPRRSKKLFDTIRSFSTPIYILFFVMVGARLSIKTMPIWIWMLVAVYVAMRSIGKWAGAYAGARWAQAQTPVRKYIGMALFAQGGVAVGLSIMASQNLQQIPVAENMSLGDMIIFTVTATTLCVQLLGPAFAKLAIKKAGEIGCNITEEDVMGEWSAGDALNTGIVPLQEGTPIETVIRHFSEQETFVYPVVDKENRVVGVLSFDLLKELLVDRDAWAWLVVRDVMQPVHDQVHASSNLAEALQDMRNMQVEALPVIDADARLLGVLDSREARRKISAEIIRRRTATS
ncbi:MAG: CBS domain-containing protein [Spartobacteria bacterium]|nr:CBS domain-containing protein [Spartobacteria bacterium]